MFKKPLLILLFLPIIGLGKNVNIPDANFRASIIWSGVDTNWDNQIQVKE